MKRIILVFLALNQLSSFAQTVKIPLSNKKGKYGISNLYRTTWKISDISKYKGYDTIRYGNWAVREIKFNAIQSQLEDLINKKMPKVAYDYIVKNDYAVDTTCLLKNVISRNSIGVFIGVKDRAKYVIVDKNGDKNFKDDEVLIFDLSKEKIYPEIEVDIDYFDGERIKQAKIPFVVDVYNEGASIEDALKLDIAFIDQTYKQGFFRQNKTQFRITVDNMHNFLYKNEVSWLCVDPAGKTESVTDRYVYTSRDSIPIGEKLYTVKSVVNDTLYLSYVAPYFKGRGEINTIAPQIKGEEFMTNKHFSLNQEKGHYVLLDFWGSWCKPCVGLLPELVGIHSKYRDNGLQVISIAFDSKKDVNKLKDLINEHKLIWKHLFVDRDGPRKITKDYLVQIYPTTILINPSGKVLLRGTGEKSLIEIDKILAKAYKNHLIKN